MYLNKLFHAVVFFCLFSGVLSCKKYLGQKPDSNLHTIETITDLQKIMDNNTIINGSYPSLSELVSDEIYMNATELLSIDSSQRKNYLWIKDDNTLTTWSMAYTTIANVNIVLESINDMDFTNAEWEQRDNIKGSALFIRAFYFYGLAQLFAPPYDSISSAKDAGIPIRLSADVNEESTRASVKETYNRILQDLKESLPLLPRSPVVKTRPGKAAALGALARIYLGMAQYDSALEYSNQYLAIRSELADYNALLTSVSPLIDRFNIEVVFQMKSALIGFFRPNNKVKIDSTLYRSFSDEDLRKTIHFKETDANVSYNGEFDGGQNAIASNISSVNISTDEIYLIRAEALARKNNVKAAMDDLNKLLESRYKKGSFVPLTAASGAEAISKILAERKKHLIRRGQRWTDIRRLARQSPDYTTSIMRSVNGQIYKLPAKPYLFLLPRTVILLSGMAQNE